MTATTQDLQFQAKCLYQEYKSSYQFYSVAKKRGLVQRLKNLATRLDPKMTEQVPACMYLDHLALWLDVDLNKVYFNN